MYGIREDSRHCLHVDERTPIRLPASTTDLGGGSDQRKRLVPRRPPPFGVNRLLSTHPLESRRTRSTKPWIPETCCLP